MYTEYQIGTKSKYCYVLVSVTISSGLVIVGNILIGISQTVSLLGNKWSVLLPYISLYC